MVLCELCQSVASPIRYSVSDSHASPMESPGRCRLINAGLLIRQGMPPHATYLFKHALVQDAAYGTLLRDARRSLHARIAGTLEGQFAEIAENHPELVARHCTEAGLVGKAASLWGKAGQRSLERSALAEAAEQLGRALSQLETLPSSSTLRHEQIKLQVLLITPLLHMKGFAAVDTKAALERARLMIEEAERRGDPSDDPLLLFSVLHGVISPLLSNLFLHYTFDIWMARNHPNPRTWRSTNCANRSWRTWNGCAIRARSMEVSSRGKEVCRRARHLHGRFQPPFDVEKHPRGNPCACGPPASAARNRCDRRSFGYLNLAPTHNASMLPRRTDRIERRLTGPVAIGVLVEARLHYGLKIPFDDRLGRCG
jgi:hypothetical protein